MELHNYRADCYYVTDGDTIKVEIDAGFHMKIKETLRLSRVNTPEKKQPGFQEAKDFVTEKVLNKEIHIHTEKDESFGRWLAEVSYFEDGKEINLNNELLDRGLAVFWKKSTGKNKVEEEE